MPGTFVAEIGYISNSVNVTTPGGQLIGQHRPTPDDVYVSAG